jgi:hypothetical protein
VDGQRAEIRDEPITVITHPYPWEAGAYLCYIRGSFGRRTEKSVGRCNDDKAQKSRQMINS